MKTWQIFAIGMAVLIATMVLETYEAVLAGVGALAVVAAVVLGFLVRPRKDVFYIRTTTYDLDPDGDFSVEHECLAVRVELARLWLLFVPTFGAVAFLLYTYAKGTTWNFSVLDRLLGGGVPVYFLFICRGLLVVIVGLLSMWLSERWVLRDADACSAGSLSVHDGRVSYMFVSRQGEYYGGEGLSLGIFCSDELSTVVLYNIAKPQLNKIAMGCLFHRLVVLGRGVTDLDAATVASRAEPIRSTF